MLEISHDLRQYSSPLALLDHIIRDLQAELYALPIAEITSQYLEVLEQNSQAGFDMELASEFIIMASTLMQIKARLLLPGREAKLEESGPLDELVLQLMAYRRMKILADNLQERFSHYGGSFRREALRPSQLGLEKVGEEAPLRADLLWAAAERMAQLNAQRYNQQNLRIKRLLKPERFTIKDAVRNLFRKFRTTSRFFFHELFPAQAERGAKVSGFLAVLELINSKRLEAKQDQAFGPISLVRSRQEPNADER
ncbi:MAG: segregation/condensation protein A [Eubacteriales bacterium]|nr:segregation/condensation protein A [Eubacteriales bacterium]